MLRNWRADADSPGGIGACPRKSSVSASASFCAIFKPGKTTLYEDMFGDGGAALEAQNFESSSEFESRVKDRHGNMHGAGAQRQGWGAVVGCVLADRSEWAMLV